MYCKARPGTAKKNNCAKNQTVFYSPTHVAQSFLFARSHSSSSAMTCTNPSNVVVLFRFSSPRPSNKIDDLSSDSDVDNEEDYHVGSSRKNKTSMKKKAIVMSLVDVIVKRTTQRNRSG
jgi:hypothetical protein